MAGPCPTCGQRPAGDLPFCPHCGSPMNRYPTPPAAPLASGRPVGAPPVGPPPSNRSGWSRATKATLPAAVLVLSFAGYIVLTTGDLASFLVGIVVVVILNRTLVWIDRWGGAGPGTRPR